MIDKQKLIKWVEDKKYVYSGPYANDVEENRCKGALKILSMLDRDVSAGNLDVEEVAHERSEAPSTSATRT